ncbi:S9 family peptidase [Limnochorda pilosa]|uniref:Peptidase S9 prolyl oligopeptidase catalytic domain-containing protein n=1 Tax=Limnochorda pilosa TaxID=1555112 RepID=A0A0K2SK31_LIMPI|nr:S9 family peptidase [Limnochorda pilosa]BAS27184.1 hypothetical protein LIP_1333 [Limnochorda pilosa]
MNQERSAGGTSAASTPARPFEPFFAHRRYYPTGAFSPSGDRVAYVTDTSGQFNLWIQPWEGGWPHQRTAFEEEIVREIAWSPVGDRIVFLADRRGDEFWQVYSLDLQGGWPRKLTDEPGVRHEFGGTVFAPDGRAIVYSANARDPEHADTVLLDLATGERRVLVEGSNERGQVYPVAWSPDGRQLACLAFRGNTDQGLLIHDLDRAATREIFPAEGPVSCFPVDWTADGQGLLVVTDQGREFKGLGLHRPGGPTGNLEWLEAPEWDVELVFLSEDRGAFLWATNEDGASRLFARRMPQGPLDGASWRSSPPVEVRLPEASVVHHVTLSADGQRAMILLNRARRPTEVYVADLSALATGAAARIQVRPLTDGFIGAIPEEELVAPERVSFSTWDGRTLSGWLYRPAAAGPDHRVPVVLSIHGGPESQERPIYVPFYQVLLDRGIGVFAPNVRGSSGYGRTFQRLIYRDWGGGELKDFEACARFLQGLDWVDPERVGVFGGSFGGFATLSCISRLPRYWAAAVDIVGPSNLVTFAKSVPPTWRDFMAQWVGDPEKDADLLRERSPITYVEQIRAPLLVIQGANDPRVNRHESEQMVERLRELGREVEYLVFEDEGHGFTKRANNLKAYRATAAFFEGKLLGAAVDAAS